MRGSEGVEIGTSPTRPSQKHTGTPLQSVGGHAVAPVG
jgi:hypothetical protein